jgi:eukaryotic-like serine/threonine-protein kinase
MSEPSLLSPQTVIAKTYEIERMLGKGGMGEVWLAKHLRLSGKLVAIKVLRAMGSMQGEALARFKREAEIAAKLEHPNIVQVSDFDTLPTGEPFLVMEFLKGESLAARLGRGPMPLSETLNILKQVGAALQVAHRAGVVHRDLKPENIFLVPTGIDDQVKVLDFGISKLADSASIQTTDSVLIGTPLYMSPEQALGQNSDVTSQSDLFSLGSIAFEMITGKAPFAAESIAKVVFKVAYEKSASLGTLRADLPNNVVSAVERALEKDRTLRTRDIETFVTELTGTSLAPSQSELSNLMTAPGAMSESMMGNTLASNSQLPTATPEKHVPANQAPTGAASQLPPGSSLPSQGVSGKKLAVSLVVVCVSVAVGVIVLRSEWKKMASTVDAGPDSIFLKDPTMKIDVTPSGVAVFVPVLSDSGIDSGVALPERVDAGEPMDSADAGTVRVTKDKPKSLGAPTEEEEAYLKEISSWDPERVIEKRNQIRLMTKSPNAKARGLEFVLLAFCSNGDILKYANLVTELRALVGSSGLKKTKDACVKMHPGASNMSW